MKIGLELTEKYAKNHVPVRFTIYLANKIHWTNVVLILAHRLRRWPNIKSTLDQYLVFSWVVRYWRVQIVHTITIYWALLWSTSLHAIAFFAMFMLHIIKLCRHPCCNAQICLWVLVCNAILQLIVTCYIIVFQMIHQVTCYSFNPIIPLN